MTALALSARASSRSGRGSLYVIAFAAAAVGAGTGRAVTTTYLPVLLDRIDDAPGLIGLVMLVNAAAGFSVPLVIGYWSDQRRSRGLGARLPFVLGGSLLAAGGLVAVALGASSSYLALAVFAATVYVGLNAITTAHRALVAELFPSGDRARATSAQELALLAGGLLGLAAGGVLADVALWAPFAAAALLLPLTAIPTLLGVDEPHAEARDPQERHALRYYIAVAARPGVRGLLLAEWLWVMGYAALPAFFILYAEKVLDLSLARASLVLAAFGLVTAAAMFAAGRVKRPELLQPLLLAGIALMGGGLLAVPLSTNLLATTPALIAAAAGFGIVSTVGFPFLASMIPEGEAGAYTALFFSVRAIASTVALPLAGALIAFTESYRTLFVLGGTVTLLGLVALAGIPVPERRPSAAWARRWTTSVAALYAVVLGTGVLVAGTGLQGLDEMVFRWINVRGPGPELLFELLEQPVRNYALLATLIFGAALLMRPRKLGRLFALELVSVGLALALLQALYAVFDRPRPSEVFESGEIVLAYGHNWAAIESFPSGHMAVVTALAASAWFAIPAATGDPGRVRRPERLHPSRVRGALPGGRRGGRGARVRQRARKPLAVLPDSGAAGASREAAAGDLDPGQHAGSDADPRRRPRPPARPGGARQRRGAHDRRRRVGSRHRRRARPDLRRARGGARPATGPPGEGSRAADGRERLAGAAACSRGGGPDRCRRPASPRGDTRTPRGRVDGGAGDRRPLRRPRSDAAEAPARESDEPQAPRADDGTPRSRHAVRLPGPPRPRSGAADLRERLRGREPPPEVAPGAGRRRRLGAYPGDLRRRAKRIPVDPGLRPRRGGSAWPRRKKWAVARPTATPSRLPTSTSDQK